MIDRATAFESTCIQLEVAAWWSLHYKTKNYSLQVIHDYVLLPMYLVFTVLYYMKLFARLQSI